MKRDLKLSFEARNAVADVLPEGAEFVIAMRIDGHVQMVGSGSREEALDLLQAAAQGMRVALGLEPPRPPRRS